MAYTLRRGLITPTITIVNENGYVLESEQRKIFQHVVQNGFGTDVIFANGTTGEWNQLSNHERLRLMEIAVDETNRINAELQKSSRPQNIEIWLGINGNTKQEILTNLEAAIKLNAHAVVIAPLAIDDLDEADIVRFFRRELNELIEAAPREMPVFLYDNADINSPGRTDHIRTHIVKDLSRLPWIYGIKVSASRRVLGNYTKAALHFKQPNEFGIYIGNANLIFDWYRPKKGFINRLQSGWRNWLLHDQLPIGVISGQEPLSSARRAAATARSTAAPSPLATGASSLPVAGSILSKVAASCHSPPIRSPCGARARKAAAAGEGAGAMRLARSVTGTPVGGSPGSRK